MARSIITEAAHHSKLYESALLDATLVQMTLLGLTLLMTEGGLFFHLCIACIVGCWVGALIHIARYPHTPTPGALWRLRWGFIILFVGSILVTGCVGGLGI